MPTFLERHTLGYKERYAKSLVASTTLSVHSKSQLPILVTIDTPHPQGVQEAPQARDAQGMNLKTIAIKHVIMIAHTCKMWMSYTNKKMSHYNAINKDVRLNIHHPHHHHLDNNNILMLLLDMPTYVDVLNNNTVTMRTIMVLMTSWKVLAPIGDIQGHAVLTMSNKLMRTMYNNVATIMTLNTKSVLNLNNKSVLLINNKSVLVLKSAKKLMMNKFL
jgi:hypothetical protein